MIGTARLTPRELNDGDAVTLGLDGGELVAIGNESLRVPVAHPARNTGPHTCRELWLEKK